MGTLGGLRRLGRAIALATAITGVVATTTEGADRKPSAPRAVEAVAGPGSAKVNWKPPRSDGGRKISGYRVVRSSSSEPKTATRVHSGERSVRLKDLTPGTTYSIEVQARNSRGWGRASNPVDATPLAEAGFGSISGPCGVVAPELPNETPSLFENRLDFGDDWFDPGDPIDRSKLTFGGQLILDTPDGGGSSKESEIMAFEVLNRCDSASLLKTETEIVYDEPGALVDMLVEVAGAKLGVRAVRAYKPGGLTQEETTTFVSARFEDLLESSEAVSSADAWVKGVLVVLAYDDSHADKVEVAFDQIPAGTKADSLLLLVTTDGADGSIYCDPDGPTC